jgi:ParB-like nuclease domain
MPTEFLSLDKIVIDRELQTDEGLEELAASINTTQLRVPILVDANFNLIDGLRRYKAHQILGRDMIEAYVSWTYEESIQWLTTAHEDAVLARPLTPRRIYEIFAVLVPQVKARSVRIKESWRGIPKKDRKKPGPYYNSRIELAKALKLNSESIIQEVQQLYRMENEDSPRGVKAREIIARVDAGEFKTIYPAWLLFSKWRKEQALRVKGESEQRQILSATATNLRAIVNGLRPIGPIHQRIKKEEATKWLAELVEAQRQLRLTIRQLRQKIK